MKPMIKGRDCILSAALSLMTPQMIDRYELVRNVDSKDVKNKIRRGKVAI